MNQNKLDLEKKSALVVIIHIRKSIKVKGELSEIWVKYLNNNSRMVEVMKMVDKEFMDGISKVL